MKRHVAAVGDVVDVKCWSGIPFHFLQAARAAGFAEEPWRIDLGRITWQRWAWNAAQMIHGRKPGGFQYSDWFYRLVVNQFARMDVGDEVISFNQFVPRANSVQKNFRRVTYYIDATMRGLLESYGLGGRMDQKVSARAVEQERLNLCSASRVIGFQRWVKDSIINDCGVPTERVFTIIPGANLLLPRDFDFKAASIGRVGIERPMRLCFVGMDWRRKGLLTVMEVIGALQRRGFKCNVCVIGGCPPEIARHPSVEYLGVLNKTLQLQKFVDAVQSCDIGCLFSRADASSIAVLEFLRLGIPVAGYVVDGMGDLLPPDAAIGFDPKTDPESITDELEDLIRTPDRLETLRSNAQLWSPLLTWERCIREFQELWETGTVAKPVQPWRRLSLVPIESAGRANS